MTMDFKKSILYVALAVLGVMLWHTWLHDYPPKGVGANSAQVTSDKDHSTNFTPSADNAVAAASHHMNHQKLSRVLPVGKTVSIRSNVLDIKVNLKGGNITSAKLLKYPVSLEDKNMPVHILTANNADLYVAQSGLSVPSSNQKSAPIEYRSEKTSYEMAKGQKSLVVTLAGKTADGVSIDKIFTLKPDSYAISTDIRLKNTTKTAWTGHVYNQIARRNVPNSESFHSRSYSGASMYTPNTPYKKLTFSDLAESDVSKNVANGWIAMQQHYFLTTWVPEKGETYHYYSRSFGHGDDGKNNIFFLGFMSPQVHLKPGESQTLRSTLYVGPEIAKNLEKLGKGLGLTVDYGWLWPISKFLFWLMSEIHHFVGNWGWSIILVTILIKIAFYWFSNKSYVSMAKTRELQPRLNALKERYGDDRQGMSKAMMEMYRKEKINPMGGCLPMLIQIPVFIALYYVLIESVELRQAPFIFWIHDLSVKDPYFILPVIMGLSMLLQQKISPPPPDPAQAKMMMFLPVVFTVFFATFPAGLVLYWITNNCASILQQWYVMKTYKAKKAK